MTPAELLTQLRKLEVRLWVEGDRLRFSAPQGVLTPKLLTALSTHKHDIIELLSQTYQQSQDHSQVIVAVPRAGDIPLSFAQQRLWFIDQLQPNTSIYNIPIAARIGGPLDAAILERSMNEVVRRHEVLRTTFQAVKGQPVQRIVPQMQLLLPTHDLSSLSSTAQAAEVQHHAANEAQQPFDLRLGPLLRLRLLRLHPDEHILLLTIHHSIADGWSVSVLMRELTLLYPAFVAHRPALLPDLPIQYADFAFWQREWLQGRVLERLSGYWKQQLGGNLPVLEVPTDRPRPAVLSGQGATEFLKLSQSLRVGLERFSQQEGVTLFMTLLAAFKVLLYRYSGQTDLLVGTVAANRQRVELEPLIGFIANTLVLRTDLSGNPTFRELLARVRETTLQAYAHQDLPFDKLVEFVQPTRTLSRNPLFQVSFTLQHAMIAMERVQMGDLQIETLEGVGGEQGIAMFDLDFNVWEVKDGIAGSIEYSTDLFERPTIQRMIGHFCTLVEGIVAQPSARLSELPLLTAAEQQQLISWNATYHDYPLNLCYHQLFEAQAARTPEAIALVHQDRSLTYDQLNRRANQYAHYLRRAGVGPDVLVGISVERTLDLVVGVLAILKAGGAYVGLDPDYPKERLGFMLEDTRIPVLLTQQHLVGRLPTPHATIVQMDADWPRISAEPESNPANITLADHTAFVIYTSGSTGRPKGAVICHHGLVNMCLAWEEVFQLRTRATAHMQMASYSFDAFTGEMTRALATGGKLVIVPRDILLMPDQLYTLMRREQIDCAEFVPAVLRTLSQYLEETDQRLDFMNTIVSGADGLNVSDYLHARRFWGPNTRFINVYGVTEATVDQTYCEPAGMSFNEGLVPIGQPYPNTTAYIVDRYLQPVPIGVLGELHVGGEGLARCYFDRPDLTADRFIPNPFSATPGERIYCTGDVATFLPDGAIKIVGRIDHQVKIRGYRIELGEIEATLRQHPAVQDAVVLARSDVQSADAKRLVAYVVAAQPEQQLEARLRDFVKQKLPSYMVPSAFVLMDAFPINANGKLNRGALPVPAAVHAEQANEAPRTPAETIMAEIWQEVLGVPQVGIHDNFFEVGGHSLMATQVISRAQAAFGREIPLRALFESPTVAQLAEVIDGDASRASDVPPLVKMPRDGNLPLSFAQERLWFLDQLEHGSAAYNVLSGVHIRGALDVRALQWSLNELVRRHEILRTSFKAVAGQPYQIIMPAQTLALPIVDLRRLTQTERQAELRRHATVVGQQPFDLAIAPLLHATLLHLAEQEYALLLTMHHILTDAWSEAILIRELATLYESYAERALDLPLSAVTSPLPKIELHYADYAIWQRQWIQGAEMERLLSYWKQQLANLPPVLPLPTDRPRPAARSYRGAFLSFTFPRDVSQQIQALSGQHNVTVFMTLLAAFNILLQRYTHTDDIVVGTDVANRTQPELETMLGFFVNILVLRTDMKGNPTFEDLLDRVRDVTLGAYSHQALPFPKLLSALQTKRTLNYPPLCQVMLVLQNVPTAPLEAANLVLEPLELDTGAARFDLVLFMDETEDGLVGTWNYNADLFDATTIERLSRRFEILVARIAAQPGARISTLAWEEIPAMESKKRTTANFKQIKPKAVSTSQEQLIRTSQLEADQPLPLVIQPNVDDLNPLEWAKANRAWVETQLHTHGGLLFRGFGLNSVPAFESFAQALCPDLFSEYGDLPREEIGGKVYTSTPYPADKTIMFHNESSHLHRWPMKQFFYCVKPAEQGGETPIVDCRKLYQQLDPAIVARLREKKLLYVRNFVEGIDVPWQQFFRTSDKAAVERFCRENGMEFEWRPNGDLKTWQICPAIVEHPQTGESLFFNQIQLHHISALETETRAALTQLFAEDALPRNVYYGDGTPIEDSLVSEITEIYWRTAVKFPWQPADVVMLDNMLVAHARLPFAGTRKIVVAMGEMLNSDAVGSR